LKSSSTAIEWIMVGAEVLKSAPCLPKQFLAGQSAKLLAKTFRLKQSKVAQAVLHQLRKRLIVDSLENSWAALSLPLLGDGGVFRMGSAKNLISEPAADLTFVSWQSLVEQQIHRSTL
jgi:hypothetical protein